jgi:hypothetical protein
VNPYPVGTKKYLVAQKLMEGKDYNTIVTELKVKLGTIYNTKSELKHLLTLERNHPSEEATRERNHPSEVDTPPRGDVTGNLPNSGLLPAGNPSQLGLTNLPPSDQKPPASEATPTDQGKLQPPLSLTGEEARKTLDKISEDLRGRKLLNRCLSPRLKNNRRRLG